MSLQMVSFLTIKWQDELRRLVKEGEADEYGTEERISPNDLFSVNKVAG